MNILMFTNTFTPHVGGVARSVESFAGAFRKRGHQVRVAAPLFPGVPPDEREVIRFPAVQHFSGSDFSVPVPVPGKLAAALKIFRPQIIHSHHPFLLGDTALRVAASREIPIVFTHHTRYEEYTHYVPADSPRLKHFVVELVTGYCNLCDAVIAPSRSVADLLAQRGVLAPVEVIPTGVDVRRWAAGNGLAFRARLGVGPETFLVGHVGRLSAEKNLPFLARALCRFLLREERAAFLLAGEGPAGETIRGTLAECGLAHRLLQVGILAQGELADCYASMDVFAFASRTETQGMVLAEAMAAGTPVVAVDAPGVREVVRDGVNGRLLPQEDEEAFAAALSWMATLPAGERRLLRENAARTADGLSLSRMATRTLKLYEDLLHQERTPRELETSRWSMARRRFGEEWRIWRNIAHALGDAVRTTGRGGE